MSDDLRQRFAMLCSPPEIADNAWYQKRGKDLERIVFDLLQIEGLEPRTSYRPQGEEIDGSFMLDGKCFLLEAKWHNDTMPGSTIYQFKANVDGKLTGTIGVFLSISGYSKDTVEAVRFGKSLNIILFDKDDFEICLSGKIWFSKILLMKLRRAAETGEAYFPYKTELALHQSFSDMLFVVDGFSDQAILSHLASKILNKHGIQRRVDFAIAMGKTGIANLVVSTHLSTPAKAKIVFVVDSDGDERRTRAMLTKHLEHLPDNILVAHPSVAAWVFPTQEAYLKYLSVTAKSGHQILIRQVADVDVDKLGRTNRSFRELSKLLTDWTHNGLT